MNSDLLACVDRSRAAERAGDAAEALEWHLAVPMFQRGRHRGVLESLTRLGDDVPPWAWARWIVYQTTRSDDPGTTAGQLHRTVLKHTVETVHADQLADCAERGGDPIQPISWVAANSWFFHQALVHEAGGLALFVDELATGRLAESADLARAWVGARLGGYRVGASLPGSRLRVYDAGSASWIEVLDLGARSTAGAEGWVLGRLVPSGVEDLPMFDVPPLTVCEKLATEVAAAERPWAPVVAAVAEGHLAPSRFMREDYELLTDVQELDLLRFGTPARDYQRVVQQLREGRDEVGRAAYRILLRAAAGDVAQQDAAYVAAAALNAHADTDARGSLLRPGQHDAWLRWASLVPAPARRVLLDYALQTRQVG